MHYRAARITILALAVTFGVVWPLAGAAAGLGAGPAGVRTAGPAAGPPAPQRRRQPRRPAPAPPRADYTVFSHRTPAHQRECASCHQYRAGAPGKDGKPAAAPDDVVEFPAHGSCIGCHRQQFFARERPAPRICSVCHVGVTPRFTARNPFPGAVEAFRASERAKSFESAFRVYFPHDKHLELFGSARPPGDGDVAPRLVRAARRDQGAAAPTASCATCHQTYEAKGSPKGEYVTAPPKTLGDAFWLKKGTFKTSPESHASCFSCHSADSGLKPAPTDCAICHLAGARLPASDFDPKLAAAMGIADPVILGAWRRRHASATFPHEGGVHAEVSCTACHDVTAMNTADDRTTKVPVLSCSGEMGCHVTATADDGGALNFELDQRKASPAFECAKCHLSFRTAPIPSSHAEAVAKMKPN